jgi:hypothetical protein
MTAQRASPQDRGPADGPSFGPIFAVGEKNLVEVDAAGSCRGLAVPQ